MKKPITVKQPILDPCCGGRMWHFVKDNPLVLFADCREGSFDPKNGRIIEVRPDLILDMLHLPFEDREFPLVIFDPPHMTNCGQDSWTAKAYGSLPKDDAMGFLRKAFNECWRVLKPWGTLVMKWSTQQFSISEVRAALPVTPIIGTRIAHRKTTETYFLVFFKAR